MGAITRFASGALAAFAVGALVACASGHAATSPRPEGVWSVQYRYGEGNTGAEQWRLSPGGRFEASESTPRDGDWSLSGETLTIHRAQVTYVGALKGDQISGSYSAPEVQGVFEARREE